MTSFGNLVDRAWRIAVTTRQHFSLGHVFLQALSEAPAGSRGPLASLSRELRTLFQGALAWPVGSTGDAAASKAPLFNIRQAEASFASFDRDHPSRSLADAAVTWILEASDIPQWAGTDRGVVELCRDEASRA